MKTMKLFMGLFAFAGSILFFSCENERRALRQDITDMASDDALVTNAFNDVLKSADKAENEVDKKRKNGYKSAKIDSCPKITWASEDSANLYPLTITIDYGDGCTDEYLDTRKGKIIVEITDRYVKEGSVRTFTLENYYLNDFKVEGSKTVTNMGENSSGNAEFDIEITNGKISGSNFEITYNSSRTREWVTGNGTWSIWDDVYQITGTASGINSNGESYTKKTLSPVEINLSCRFPVSGIIELDLANEDPVELNYGDGTCNADATVSRSDVTMDITLRTRKMLIN